MSSTFDENKTKALLAYIASKVDVGKTKLMKLLYLIDFTAYEKTGKSVTNDEYKHWSLGPVPTRTWHGMKGTLIDGVLKTIREELEVGTYLRYTSVTENPDLSSFTTDEGDIINEVIENYGGMGQQELVDMLHKELPYIITRENELIPYFLAPYRNYTGFTRKEIEKIQSNKAFVATLKSAHKESQKPEYRSMAGVIEPLYTTAIGF